MNPLFVRLDVPLTTMKLNSHSCVRPDVVRENLIIQNLYMDC